MKNEKTTNFIEKARKIHGDKYNYSKVEYVNSKTKVCIICPEHGEFWQAPGEHSKGSGCPLCYKECRGNMCRKGVERFINQSEEIYGKYYNYSQVNYKDAHTKVYIICPKHGGFYKTPQNHLRGQGCPICGNLRKGDWRRSNTEEFINKSKEKHGDKYDYSKVEYINNHDKVCIICPEHGEFWQKPNDHLRGIGCGACGQKYNFNELNLLKIVKEKYGKENVIYQYRPRFLSGKTSSQSIDIFLNNFNIGIEYHGRQHFKPIKKFGSDEGFLKTQKRDLIKYEKCLKNDIKLFYITLEKCDTSNYFTHVYNNLDEMFNDINEFIKEKKINENYFKKIIHEIIKDIKNEK